jgi:hypothetical protein
VRHVRPYRSQAVRPSVNAFCAWARGVGQAERYKVPAWRPTALCKTSKGLETERRPGKEEEEVTADEIIVGIDDSPSARGLPLRTPDRPEQRLAPFMGRVAGGTGTCTSIP